MNSSYSSQKLAQIADRALDASTAFNLLAGEVALKAARAHAFGCGGGGVDPQDQCFQIDAETFGNWMFWLAQEPEAEERLGELLQAARKAWNLSCDEAEVEDQVRAEQREQG